MKRALVFVSAAALTWGLDLSAPGPAAAAVPVFRAGLRRQMPPNPAAPRPMAPAANRNVIRPRAISQPTMGSMMSPVANPFQLATPTSTFRPFRHHRHHLDMFTYPALSYPMPAYSPSMYSSASYMMPYSYPAYPSAMSSNNNYRSAATSSPDLNYTPSDAGMLRITVPEVRARVTVNDRPISPIGDVRYYVTPKLQTGQSYPYTVRAIWTRDGRTTSIEQTVYAVRGRTTEVDLTAPAAR